MADKKQVRSGDEAEKQNVKKKTAKTASKSDTKKPTSESGKTGREIWDENVIRDSETAKERGRNGGIKSGEVRRAKRDARDATQYLLDRMVVSEQIKANLKELGIEPSECTNMMALIGRLYAMGMGGNLEAFKLMMVLGGYEPEENRKERESIAADQRREKELNAKVEALGQKNDSSSLAINLDDEDGDNDVVIYMPQIASEDNCQAETEEDTPDGEQ